jgi:serpin B
MQEVNGQQSWTLAEARVQPAFASLMATLRAKRLENGYDLLTADRLWGQTGARFLNAYLGLLAKTYQADVASLDFGNPVEAARQINEWTNRQTGGFLHGNLDPRLLNMETGMALTNAVFFRGLWSDPFEPDATRPEDFRTAGKTFPVSMMTQLKSAEYAELDGVQLLQKGYLGKAVSMLIALPSESAGSLAALEKQLSPALYQRWLAALKPRDVEVHLPRFSFETQYQLRESLRAMGLRTAFEPGEADFSGIDGGHSLYLQFVFHQARVEVDEEGTRAAAMTTGGMGGGLMREPPKPVVFRADHPFLLLVRDVRTGAILFLGRVERPTPAEPAVQPQGSPATSGHGRLRPRPAPKSGANPFGS